MTLKRIKFLGLFFILPLLTGCDSVIRYSPNLFKANPENCWPCTIYMQAFRAIDLILDNALETVATNSLYVLQFALLFWLLYRVGQLLISPTMPDMKKELMALPGKGSPGILIILFKSLIVSLFLYNPSYIYELFGTTIIQPIGQGFLEMANLVLASPTAVGIDNINQEMTKNFWDTLQKIWNATVGNVLPLDISEGTSGTGTSTTTATSKMFGDLAISVQQIVYKIYDALWRGVGLGFQLLTSRDWSACIAAILLIAGMMWLLVMVPLFFVDAFVRIGLILLLSPLLLVGWVFSFPKDLVKKVIHMIFSSFFDILFNCIYITFLVSLFRVYEDQKLPYLFSASYQTTEGGLRRTATEWGRDFLILTMLTYSMLFLAKNVQNFSNYFFEGAEKSSIIDTMNKLKNWTVKAVKGAAMAFSGGIGAVKAAAEAAQNATQSAQNNTQSGGESES